jgi:hypothetical protein
MKVPARRHSAAKKFTPAVEGCISVKNLERHVEEALLAVGEKDLAVLRPRGHAGFSRLRWRWFQKEAASQGSEICIGNADSALRTRFFTLPRRDAPKLLVRGKIFGQEAKISEDCCGIGIERSAAGQLFHAWLRATAYLENQPGDMVGMWISDMQIGRPNISNA